jgi:hypothetical protein
LDVSTANALVLYNKAVDKEENIVWFKRALVDIFVGDKIRSIPQEPVLEHHLVRGEAHQTCVYCQLFGDRTTRTRYYCVNPECMLPLCHIDLRKNMEDCFVLAHANEQVRCILAQHQMKMKQKANNKPK